MQLGEQEPMTGFWTQEAVDWFLFTDPWMVEVETKWYDAGI